MGKSKRQANFELLRICAMFMVVVMHWLFNSRSLPENGRPLDNIGVTADTVIVRYFYVPE